MKYIKKVSVAPVEPITGSIVDTTNISDKTKNTYSARIINEMNTYSTEETFTGKYWIDGKPIYRKVIKTTLPNVESYTQINVSDNINEFIKMHQTFKTLSGEGLELIVPIPYTANGNTVQGNSMGNDWIIANEISSYEGKECTLIFEYTKTTD